MVSPPGRRHLLVYFEEPEGDSAQPKHLGPELGGRLYSVQSTSGLLLTVRGRLDVSRDHLVLAKVIRHASFVSLGPCTGEIVHRIGSSP